jgi:hypothetical protein
LFCDQTGRIRLLLQEHAAFWLGVFTEQWEAAALRIDGKSVARRIQLEHAPVVRGRVAGGDPIDLGVRLIPQDGQRSSTLRNRNPHFSVANLIQEMNEGVHGLDAEGWFRIPVPFAQGEYSIEVVTLRPRQDGDSVYERTFALTGTETLLPVIDLRE